MSDLWPLTHAYSWALSVGGNVELEFSLESLLRHNLNPPPGPRTWDKLNYFLQTHFIKMTLVLNKHQGEKSTKCIHCLGVSGRWGGGGSLRCFQAEVVTHGSNLGQYIPPGWQQWRTIRPESQEHFLPTQWPLHCHLSFSNLSYPFCHVSAI